MSGCTNKQLYNIREWAPLTVFEQIPARQHKGLFSTNLNITCVDAVEEFIALGSDAGIVFWYNRHTGEMQKLRAEMPTRITCVKIVNSVEYMVAAGSSSGQVSVFQIQKEVPADLNLVAPCARAKPIQRYTIRDLHNFIVTCVEWSKNGMKLYSGDRNGVVVLTEFDYQMHISKSVEMLAEAYEIVQLSVCQSYLLVSSLYRCIVCHRNEQSGQWCITQIGKKDRKQLIECGGIFLKQSTGSPPQLICGRPGLRFWLADSDGNVSKTLLFKEAVQNSPIWEVPILNPKSYTSPPLRHQADNDNSCTQPNNFRSLYLYDDDNSMVVTHDESALYLLNIDSLRVEAVSRGFRKIVDFCVCGTEIFVLEGGRSLLRLAPLPEKPNKSAKVIFNPRFPPPVPLLGASMSGSFESPVEYEPEEQSVINAQECFELPPLEELDLNVAIELAVESPIAEQNRRQEIFRKIGEMDFEQSILHTSSVRTGGNGSNGSNDCGRKKRKPKPAGIVEIGHESKEASGKQQAHTPPVTNSATILDVSYCFVENDEASSPLDGKTAFAQHLPDTLSPDSLKKTIADKAKSLAEELELPEVHLAPITDEELRASQACAAPPLPKVSQQSPRATTAATTSTSASTLLQPLAQCYPSTSTRQITHLRITPPKRQYYIVDPGKNSASKPGSGPFPTLHATNLISDEAHVETESSTLLPQVPPPPKTYLHNFLPDFGRARDPLAVEDLPPIVGLSAEPPLSDVSGEWEFLDN